MTESARNHLWHLSTSALGDAAIVGIWSFMISNLSWFYWQVAGKYQDCLMMDRRYRARSRSRTGRRSAPSHRYGATYASANKPVVYSFFVCIFIYFYCFSCLDHGPQHLRSCMVRQSLSGQAPLYLADDCRLVSDSTRRSLWSADVATCVVPRTLSSYGDRTFAASGPRLWNSLPVQLRNPDITYELFRRQLKGHLFREA